MSAFTYSILLLCLSVWGCGPATFGRLSPGAATPVPFADLQADPDHYRGQVVVLGGEVVSVSLQDGRSLLEVSQRQLDNRFWPLDQAASGGTFFVVSDRWLSPGFYVPKRKVTVSGVVQGRTKDSPLLLAREIHLWEYPRWEKWFYPVPKEWYDNDPAFEKWFTPPEFDPWKGGGGTRG